MHLFTRLLPVLAAGLPKGRVLPVHVSFAGVVLQCYVLGILWQRSCWALHILAS